MQSLKLLVVDDNARYCAALEAFFGDIELFTVLSSAFDGFSALERIAKEAPDVVILDMVMPQLDGIGVLQQLKKQPPAPNVHIFANSPFADDAMVRMSQELGVSYFLLKPMHVQYMFGRIMDVMNSAQTARVDMSQYKELLKPPRRDVSREMLIVGYLRQLGVPAHINGYLYMKTGVEYYANNYGRALGVTTDIYPHIAAVYGTKANRVERNIRHAIEYAWDHGNIDAQHKMFGYTVNDTKGRPTNKEFIAMITDKVVMQIKYR